MATAGVLFVWRLWLHVLAAPHGVWNGARLAVAVSWAKGYAYFYDAYAGPAVNIIYGPVSSFLFLPSALAENPTWALFIGESINLATFFFPLAFLVFLRARECRVSWALAAVVFMVCCAFVGRVSSLSNMMLRISSDAPSVGLGLLSCCFLLQKKNNITLLNISLCIFFANLAVWSKQIECPIFLAQSLYVWIFFGRSWFLRYVLLSVGIGFFIACFFIACFGWSEIVLNMFIVPSRHSIQMYPGGLLGRMCVDLFLGYRIWVFLLPVAYFYMNRWFLLKSAHFSDFLQRILEDIRKNNGWLFVFVCLAVLPTGSLSHLKEGGSINGIHAHYYLAALVIWVFFESLKYMKNVKVFISTVCLCVLSLFFLYPTQQLLFFQHKGIYENPQQEAFDFLKKYGDSVYFAMYPLPVLMAHGRLYHYLQVLVEREKSGFPPYEQFLKNYTPKKYDSIAFESSDWSVTMNVSRKYFPEFSVLSEDERLPGWSFFKKIK